MQLNSDYREKEVYEMENWDLSYSDWTEEEDLKIRTLFPEMIQSTKDLRVLWSEEEDRILREYWPFEGSRASQRLQNRSPAACRQRAKRLNLERDKQERWSLREDAALRICFTEKNPSIAAKRLPGRSVPACVARAVELGLCCPEDCGEAAVNLLWTEEEDRLLRKYWSSEGIRVQKRRTRRTAAACRLRAFTLGLRTPKSGFVLGPQHSGCL